MKNERLQQTMQKYIRDYYEQLYGNKMDNLEEMDRFLEKFKSSKTEPYLTICKIDHQGEFAVWLRKLKKGLCISLER